MPCMPSVNILTSKWRLCVSVSRGRGRGPGRWLSSDRSGGEREELSLLVVPLSPQGVSAVQGMVRVKRGRAGTILSTQ